MEKYKITNAARLVDGVTLHQICTSDGEYGGWVESEDNLTRYGYSWIGKSACVYGNACVSGTATVTGNAKISGDVLISENAYISGDACISGDVEICGNVFIGGNATISGRVVLDGMAIISGNALIKCQNHVIWQAGLGEDHCTTTVYRTNYNTLNAASEDFDHETDVTIEELEELVHEKYGNTQYEQDYMGFIDYARRWIKLD